METKPDMEIENGNVRRRWGMGMEMRGEKRRNVRREKIEIVNECRSGSKCYS